MKNTLRIYLIPALFLTACGNRVKTTRWENGRKIVEWTTPENAEKLSQERRVQDEKAAVYRQAEKRGPRDPLTAALSETEVEEVLKENVEGRLFAEIRKNFENGPIINLADQNIPAKAQQKENARFTGPWY